MKGVLCMKKKLLIIGLLAVVTVGAINLPKALAYVSGKSIQVQQNSNNQPSEAEKAEISNKMEKHWKDVIDAHKIDRTKWIELKFDKKRTLLEKPYGALSLKEGALLLDAFFTEGGKYSQVGDCMPLLLIHPTEKKALIVFQRDYGKGAKVVLTLTPSNNLNEEGVHPWVVSSEKSL